MARKRTLSTLDTSIAYEAVGLDLAKEDVALAAFDSDHKEPYLIDRIPYDKLASPRPWFKVLVYVAAKLVRIATALLKYGETFSYEKAGISKAVLKQWELEQAKAA